MPQFFIDSEFGPGDEIDIRGAKAHHISDVLRLKPGDWIVISDGRGLSYRSTIIAARAKGVTISIGEQITRKKNRPPPALALSMIKGDRFEWALQKAVEIGCERLFPFCSSRCVPRYAKGAMPGKLGRWQRIAVEAARQSGLPLEPKVERPCDFAKLLEVSRDFGRIILFYEGERERSMRAIWESAPQRGDDLLIIGPEGGFAADEIAKARARGAITASLGSQILRVETAAIAAISIWQYELGNMEI